MMRFVESFESRRVVRVLAVVVAGCLAASARAEVPHTFTSGTPARAAEVNANFAALDARIATANAALDARIAEVNAAIAQLAERGAPVGSVVAFAGTTAPAGWLLCDGAAVSRTSDAALFAVLGVSHGNGDQIETFNVPDYRGRFLRGTDGGAGRDPDRNARSAMGVGGAAGDAVGSVQGSQLGSHAHSYTDPGHSHAIEIEPSGGWDGAVPQGSNRTNRSSWATAAATTRIQILNTGGNETRPTNAGVNYIIKY
jgi:microcystin-dependent protein